MSLLSWNSPFHTLMAETPNQIQLSTACSSTILVFQIDFTYSFIAATARRSYYWLHLGSLKSIFGVFVAIMKDFPSCFGENGVQIADSSSSSSSSSSSISKAAQNLVTCVYQCKLRGRLSFIALTWTKHLMGQGFSLQIENSANQCLCKLDIKPWLFLKKKGSKIFEIESRKMEIHWDLTNAKFGSGPEPEEGFFVAVVFDRELIFRVGDSPSESAKKIAAVSAAAAVFVARREHVFGKKLFYAKARFSEKGKTHNVSIECDSGGLKEPSLVIRIDSKTAMQIKRLKWKFRGNDTIVVDGIPVQVMWDVHNWLFGNSAMSSSAVFMFQTHKNSGNHTQSSLLNSSSSSSSSSYHEQQIKDSKLQSMDFSLILYAWRNEWINHCLTKWPSKFSFRIDSCKP